MSELFFVNVNSGKKYKVLGIDKVKGTITLKGPNAEFDEPYDKERFKKLGYTLEKVESDHAVE